MDVPRAEEHAVSALKRLAAQLREAYDSALETMNHNQVPFMQCEDCLHVEPWELGLERCPTCPGRMAAKNC